MLWISIKENRIQEIEIEHHNIGVLLTCMPPSNQIYSLNDAGNHLCIAKQREISA